MTTILRPYQQEIADEIPVRLKQGPVLVQAPARSGKSKIIAYTAARVINKGLIPIVLTHRGKIKAQLVEHVNGESIDANTDHIFIQKGKCYVAMNQSLLKRPNILNQITAFGNKVVFLIDEAHRSDFNRTFDLAPQSYKIGFTATPAWRWSKFLHERYISLIHGPQVRELIASGNITNVDYYEMRNDLSTLVKSNTGDFTEQSQYEIFDKAKLYDGLFDELKKFEFNKCIVFCASKKAADQLDIKFKEHHYNSTVFYSGKQITDLIKFTQFDAKILITVSALSEGFDHPPIDMNVLWRATTSLPLYIQMGMRGATPHPGKLKTTVLDFGGNNSRFGGKKNIQALTMDRDWNALWQPPPVIKKTGAGVAAIKNCPACDYIISATAKSCCNCGYIYPEAEIKMKIGELVKIEHDIQAAKDAINKLAGRKISELTPAELAAFAKQRDKKPFCARVAKAKEVKNPGWLKDYARHIGYKSGWARWQIENMPTWDDGTLKEVEFHDITIK